MGLFYAIYAKFMLAYEIIVEFSRNFFRFIPGYGPTVYESNKRINGKVVIITGANSGIGKETAKDLARRGGKIIMACRDVNKAESVAKEIQQSIPSAKLIVKKLDLSSLESVRKFAQEVNRQESQVDYLINNAGVMMCPKWSTKDGFEMQFGTNHLGHFLLTMLLLEKLKASSSSRIINVSSHAYVDGQIHFGDINLDSNYDPIISYSQSKLANVLFTRELARRLKGSNVKTYVLHPGVIWSDLNRHLTGAIGFADSYIFPLFKINPWLGCQTTLYLTLDDAVNDKSGSFFVNCSQRELYSHGKDDVAARRLWDLSCSLVKIDANKIGI